MSVAIVEDRVWQRERLTPEEAEVLAVELRWGSSIVVSQSWSTRLVDDGD
jgi:hypothetical protein